MRGRGLPINVVSAAHMLVANVTSQDLCFFSLAFTMVEHVDHFQLTRAAREAVMALPG